MPDVPRGIRNHNPGNIRRSKTPWQGLADDQPDPEFFRFRAPEWGIRAMARILITYKDKHRIKRLRTVVKRWAPPVENDTQAYIDHVAFATGLDPDAALDLHSYAHVRPLIEAMILHENGRQPYSAEVIDRGLEMAGIAPDKPRKLPTASARAGAATAGGAAIASGASMLSEAQPALPLLNKLADHLPAVVIGLVIAGVAFAAWRWYQDRKGCE